MIIENLELKEKLEQLEESAIENVEQVVIE